MIHFDRTPLIVFQTSNPMAATRLDGYLRRKGWQRITRGIYRSLTQVEDRTAFWEHIQKEFLNSDEDFFAFLTVEEMDLMSDHYYNKKAPDWPLAGE